jgi:hypothetical protein
MRYFKSARGDSNDARAPRGWLSSTSSKPVDSSIWFFRPPACGIELHANLSISAMKETSFARQAKEVFVV